MSGFEFSYMSPQEEPRRPTWQKFRSMGFTPLWFKETVIGDGPQRPDAWACRRGCGTLVWDPKTHMENICIGWAPRVGDDDGQ